MLISFNWLKKYLPEFGDIDKENLALLLTESLAEVEQITPIRQDLKNIVCAEVMEVNRVPESTKLSVCKVKINEDLPLRTVICGAPNVKAGIKVALALPDGKVYSSKDNKTSVETITQKNIFNITSEGMLCSPRELGLSNEHEGIIILQQELPIGTDLTLILKDYVYEIENKSLSHRPDCFCHEGIAREISAIYGTPFIDNKKEVPLVPIKILPFELKVKVEPQICLRFTTICLSDVNVCPSPIWLQSLISAVGIRPINNVVDVSNYVMLDKGQPIHTYDYDKVAGAKLTVKYAKNKEKADFLNEKEYELNDSIMVIANSNNIENIAGIIGGANSEITSNTKNVLIEAANFNMYSIRKTSKYIGLRTESSTRFEKGLDPNITIKGLKTAAELILDLAHGEVASDINDYYPIKREEKTIELDLTSIKRFLGIELPTKDIIEYLKRLGLKIESEEKIAALTTVPDTNIIIRVVCPTFRADLNISNDLLEEIARLYGYSKLIPSLPTREITSVNMGNEMKFFRKVRRILTATGMDEISTYSFLSEKLYKRLGLDIKNCLALKNPISPELAYVRNLIVPNLIEKVIQNKNKYQNINIFEMGRVVYKELDAYGIHKQPILLAGAMYKKDTSKNLFFRMKGILQELFNELVVEVRYTEYELKNDQYKNLIHQGRTANIYVENDKIGIIAEVSPSKLSSELDIDGRIAFFELNTSSLINFAQFTKNFHPISIFPEVSRDLSLVVPKKVNYSRILELIKELDIKELKNIEFVDVFNNDKLGDNFKSITIKIHFQSEYKTLKDTEINKDIDQIISMLSSKLQVTLRNT